VKLFSTFIVFVRARLLQPGFHEEAFTALWDMVQNHPNRLT
jgi:hypothetical protein